MIFYQSLSVAICAVAAAEIYWMIRILIKYEVPKAWQIVFFYFFVATVLLFFIQCYVLFYPVRSKWPLKAHSAVFCMVVFSFCRAIRSVSMYKKNFYKDRL